MFMTKWLHTLVDFMNHVVRWFTYALIAQQEGILNPSRPLKLAHNFMPMVLTLA
jgi:hypothetical protein